MNWLKLIFRKKGKAHSHIWKTEFMIGNIFEGKSRIVSCKCGQKGIYHFGSKEVILLDSKEYIDMCYNELGIGQGLN